MAVPENDRRQGALQITTEEEGDTSSVAAAAEAARDADQLPAEGEIAPEEEVAEEADTEAATGEEAVEGSPLLPEDLVLDRALRDPDKDQFDHLAIAKRVADLAATAEPPVNIALFGPWGSGKSSLAGLIQGELAKHKKSVLLGGTPRFALVYYDAWRYGGHSLRRNFITNAAKALHLEGDRYRQFYEGLYETSRRAELHLGKFRSELWRVGGRAVGFFVLFASLIAGVIALTHLATDQNAWDEIKQHLPTYLGPTAVGAFIVAVVKSLLDAGRVDIDQKAPSDDEEFSDRFTKLIAVARKKPPRDRWWLRLARWITQRPHRIWLYLTAEEPATVPDHRPYERLIFFIDELDRCSKEDVVETLVAIRTFLDEEHCVFIVAADRAVLEEALDKEVPQETPVNEDSPYYSTAGAFLDKVFQHQISLPPLRGRRLTRYARDLVRERDSGLWSELREAGRLDSAIYALIPSHVRSPRRVKVLLNNFATNIRIGEARGVRWVERADEIAKLTVLQTEFPALADDLALEPRLPRFLLNPDDPGAKTKRASALVKRHDLKNPVADPETFLPDEASADNKEKAKQESERLKDMREKRQQQLRRYLERTAGVPELRRDLLYLEAAGAAFDLADPELGDRIEDDAPDRPDEVVAAIRDQLEGEQLKAMRLLADMVQDLLGPERSNVVSALLMLAYQLEDELTPRVVTDTANAIKAYLVEQELAADQLVGALAIAQRAEEHDLVLDLVRNDLLWEEPERVAAVAGMTYDLPEFARERLRTRVAEELPNYSEVVSLPAQLLPEDKAIELLQDPEVRRAVVDFIASGGTPDPDEGEV